MSAERTPLLSGTNGDGEHSKPTPLSSAKHLAFSWFNVLLVFVPLTFLAEGLKWSAPLRFTFSFLSIIPLAKLLGDATEQLAIPLGQTLGGLLNATFGNAVELIVGIVALSQGQLRLVQTSMIGSILSNLLLVLGMSFFAGGLKFSESHFSATAALTMSSLMVLSCITLVIPAAYHSSQARGIPPNLLPSFSPFSASSSSSSSSVQGLDLFSAASDQTVSILKESKGLLMLSRGTAIILFLVYIAFLVFQLKTHSNLFESEGDEEEEEQSMGLWSSAVALGLITLMTSFMADYLVASIDETCEAWGVPKAFVGLILLPLVGNAAEHVTSVWMAVKGKNELVLGISIGSSIQIAAGMIPLLVILGWIMGQELTLFFSDFETIVLFVSVLLVNSLVADGSSNFLEGLMLMSLYFVVGIALWVS